MDERLLPAVVLGIDTPIGLAIVRDLGRRGVPVYGVARSARALGMASRHLARGMVRAAGEAGTLAQLQTLAADLGPACLFAIAESDITWLNGARAQLPAYRMMFADADRMARVLHKDRTYAAAAAAGIDVPHTVHPRSMAQAAALAPCLRYPVVLKWANPNAVAARLRAAGLALEKLCQCADAPALLARLSRYEGLGTYPMVQEYRPGHGLGQFVLMQGGVAYCRFQHCRLHEWPPEGGISTLCESIALTDHVELMARSVALLRALDWEGVAMVEYRYDPATGRAALMEVNGRFWGSLPLACQAGASFPWLCYQLLGLGLAVHQPAYTAGLRCRFMVPETRRLLRVLASRQPGRWRTLCSYLADFTRADTRYFVHDRDDRGPMLRDLRNMGAGALSRLRTRLVTTVAAAVTAAVAMAKRS
jgi:predicted ATP-grasp superfamily ATP-dependent carboligase